MYLDHRETSLGGYTTLVMDFYIQGVAEAIKVLVYVALPSNPQYLGPAPLDQIASEIVVAEGCNGHNVEYVAKLSAFMKLHVPGHQEDHHLQSLVIYVKTLLHEMNAPHMLKFFEDAIKFFPRFEQDSERPDSTRLPDETWNKQVCDGQENELINQDSKCKSVTLHSGSLRFEKTCGTDLYLFGKGEID